MNQISIKPWYVLPETLLFPGARGTLILLPSRAEGDADGDLILAGCYTDEGHGGG